MPAPSQGRQSAQRGAPQQRKVVVIPLCIERQFTTLGTTTYKYFVVGPGVLTVGPQIEDIVIHGRGKDFTPVFNWKCTAEKSFDGDGWTIFGTELLGVQTSAAPVAGTPHISRADYWLNIRFLIGVANGSGTTIEVGNLTAYAAIKFWS